MARVMIYGKNGEYELFNQGNKLIRGRVWGYGNAIVLLDRGRKEISVEELEMLNRHIGAYMYETENGECIRL